MLQESTDMLPLLADTELLAEIKDFLLTLIADGGAQD